MPKKTTKQEPLLKFKRASLDLAAVIKKIDRASKKKQKEAEKEKIEGLIEKLERKGITIIRNK